MKKNRKILDVQWMVNESLFIVTRLIIPLFVCVVTIYFFIMQDDYSIHVFLINLGVAVLVAIYLIGFIVNRMVVTFRKDKIARKQKKIVKSQSPGKLGMGFALFLLVVLLLFSLTIYYGTETGPFRWVLTILDFLFFLAVVYSAYWQKK